MIRKIISKMTNWAFNKELIGFSITDKSSMRIKESDLKIRICNQYGEVIFESKEPTDYVISFFN